MGCGKSHPAKAPDNVIEPEPPQKKLESRSYRSGKSGSGTPSPSPLRTAASPGIDGGSKTVIEADPLPISKDEPLQPVARLNFSEEDVSLRPPRPPPPPSITGASISAPSGGHPHRGGNASSASRMADVNDLRSSACANSDLALNAMQVEVGTSPQVHTPQETEAAALPGTICTTPRGQHPTPIINTVGLCDATSGSKSDTVGKAFMALESPTTGKVDIDTAFAVLAVIEDDAESPRASNEPAVKANGPATWPTDLQVALASRLMVCTWARWARSSLRIKEERRIKALQHTKYPKFRFPKTPPISPQPTPRAEDSPDKCSLDRDSNWIADGHSALPSRIGGKRHPNTANRGRNGNMPSSDSKNLFEDMAEKRKEAQEDQAMKMKLKTNFAIEEAHTMDAEKTPGFGTDTPAFGQGSGTASASRMSSSVVSSGVASPMAGGQMSPWLLEAEALCNGEEDAGADEIPTVPSTNAWGFTPAQLEGVPEGDQDLHNEFDEIIGDGDELEQVGFFIPQELSAAEQPQDRDGHRVSADVSEIDSMATTATSTAALPSGRSSRRKPCEHAFSAFSSDAKISGSAASLEDSSSLEPAPNATAAADNCEYTIGDKVSYWSGSKGVWLPAVIVEKKSRNVWIIDKQMKGCLAKVRSSDLISAAEQNKDPVLRALALFDNLPVAAASKQGTPRASSSRSGTPRASSRAGTSHEASRGTPMGTSPRGSTWQPPGGASPRSSPLKEGKSSSPGASSFTPELDSRKHSRKAERGTPGKSPAIHATLPRALEAFAGPASKSPTRGKIVRDDFSDDSD